jgi:hypothetical protein
MFRIEAVRGRSLQMKAIGKASLLLASALGAGIVLAQSVERDGKVVSKPSPTVAQASTTAPIQTAQAGGAAGGAATGGAVAAETIGLGTVIVVGAAVAAIAIATDPSETTTHH